MDFSVWLEEIKAWREFAALWEKNRSSRPPTPPKIVCAVCGQGPLSGALLRKIGPRWWICKGAAHADLVA